MAYVLAFTDMSVSVDDADASANTCRGVRERTCKLMLSVRSGCGRYLVLSCGQL